MSSRQGHLTYVFLSRKRVQLLNSLRDVLERLSTRANIGKIKKKHGKHQSLLIKRSARY